MGKFVARFFKRAQTVKGVRFVSDFQIGFGMKTVLHKLSACHSESRRDEESGFKTEILRRSFARLRMTKFLLRTLIYSPVRGSTLRNFRAHDRRRYEALASA